MKVSKKIVNKFICIIIIILLLQNNIFAVEINPTQHIFNKYNDEDKKKIDGTSISLENIPIYVHEKNANVLTNWQLYKNTKDKNKVSEDYRDAADNLESLADSSDSDVQAAMFRAQAYAMTINADNNVNDSNINFLSYYIVEQNIIFETKTLLINYFIDSLNADKQTKTLYEVSRQYETAKNNYDFGNLTLTEFLAVNKLLKDTEAGLIMANSKVVTTKRNLYVNCGEDITKDIEIKNVDFINENMIYGRNVEKDINDAIENNIQYDIYKRRYENATVDEIKKQQEILRDSAPNFIRSDILTKYNNLCDGLTSLNNNLIALKYYEDDLKKAKNELNNGQISKKEYMTKEYNKQIAEIDAMISNYSLVLLYETYLNAINGLANAGGNS